MSSVETPTPPATVERRCPRCDAPLSADQEWCLSCGAGVGTRIAGPRGWRAPLAVVGVLLALALIAVVLAIVELARDAEGVQEVAATPTPAPSVMPEPTPAPGAEGGATPSPVPTPSATATAGATATGSATPDAGGAAASPGLTEWPERRTAWTVVLNSSGTREDAERLAGDLAAKGVPDVGVLDSDDFESLGPDSFVVFSGVYDSEADARAALAQVRDEAGGGSARRIVPSK